MLPRQHIIEFTNLKEAYIRRNNHFRVEIWDKTEESKTSSDLLDLGGLNQILVDTDHRHVF